jgi:hypothetical protein
VRREDEEERRRKAVVVRGRKVERQSMVMKRAEKQNVVMY